jgi:phospholipid/cholesterol/gamma-HCH transport system substrate-binding protein
MSERSLELKVGALILVSLGLLGAFLIVLGGFSFEPTYSVNVDFDNPGGLQEGAPIRISGVKVGKVDEILFRTGQVDATTGEAVPNIRVVANIETQHKDKIHDNARFYVTSRGMLGEPYLAIDPGSLEAPLLESGAAVYGVSPPRLDLLLSETYELLHRSYVALTANEKEIAETFDGLRNTLKGSGDFFQNNGERLTNIVSNAEALSGEANEMVVAARARYVDGTEIKEVLADIRTTMAAVRENVPTILQDGRKVVAGASRLTESLSSEAQVARIERITADLEATIKDARAATQLAETMTQHIAKGQGTVGALLMDEAMYDDLQELTRDLKHNPWKFFWRE